METTIAAPGITCEGCAATIKQALGAVGGVKSVEVDVPAKTVRVFHDQSASREALTGALAAAGYPEAGAASTGHAGGVKDPVCGMTVEPATAAGSEEYRGRTYYFCSAHCLSKFRAAPDRYTAGP